MVTKAKLNDRTRREALIEECQSYVRSVAGQFCKTMGLDAGSFDDVVSAGYLGLVEAAERYDFSSGKKFKTFAFLRIRGAIIDSFRETCDVSGRGYRYIRAFEALQNEREEEFILAESEKKEISSEPSKVGKKLARIFDHAARGVLAYRLSLNEIDEDSQPHEPQLNPDERIESQQEWQRFLRLINKLPEKERLIVTEYYLNGKSFMQIAQEYPVFSKSWISRLHTRALDLLRQAYEQAVETEYEVGVIRSDRDVRKRVQGAGNSQSDRTRSTSRNRPSA